MWEEVREKVEGVTGSLLAGAALLAVLARYRRILRVVWRAVKKRWRRGREMSQAVCRLESAMGDLKQKTDQMHYQLHPNGGRSLNDEVQRIRNDVSFLLETYNLAYRDLPYPAFHCAKDGRNTFVSEAYQRLLGLGSGRDLDSLNWHGFVHPDDLEGYFQAFKVASASGSDFRYAARFQRSGSEPVGLWRVEASRLRDGSYMGRLFPEDELALRICEENGWNA